MLYSKFIFHAKQETINKLDNGIWYLEPEWKDIICRDMDIKDISELEDSYVSDWWDVENILHLEVERRNAQDNKQKDVIEWLYDLIHSTVEPAILEEETEYIKNVIEFMKLNRENNNLESV